MYLAELHGKLSRNVERKEDILTSNVFSFFKYSRRDVFLKKYLEKLLGLQFPIEDLKSAEFVFWPTYDDSTEPDLVILIGSYYLLFEAKYYSDFGKESSTKKDQITREIEGGYLEATRLSKQFFYIAITADSVYREEKIPHSVQDMPGKFVWTNWQRVSSLIEQLLSESHGLEHHELCHAEDLYRLLDKKNLRSFNGFNLKEQFAHYDQIFFNVESSKYRGDFIGFQDSLSDSKQIGGVPSTIFYNSSKCARNRDFYSELQNIQLILPVRSKIFFKGGLNDR